MRIRKLAISGLSHCGDLSLSHLGLMTGSWLLVAALARVGMPQISPDASVPGQMEKLATLALALPCIASGRMLLDRLPWLVETSAVDLTRWRLSLIGLLTAAQSVALWVAATIGQLPTRQCLLVWLLLWSCTIGAAASQSAVWALGVAPVAVVVVFSLPIRVIPWGANIIYNSERVTALGLTAISLFVLACVLYSRRS